MLYDKDTYGGKIIMIWKKKYFLNYCQQVWLDQNDFRENKL